MLFAQGRNAVQVQRWLGHHSAAFTLSTYVHLLDGGLGEPLSLGDPTRRLTAASDLAGQQVCEDPRIESAIFEGALSADGAEESVDFDPRCLVE